MIIEITAEAIFDLLHQKEAISRWDYKDLIIKINNENSLQWDEDYTKLYVNITKQNVIWLLVDKIIEFDENHIKLVQ